MVTAEVVIEKGADVRTKGADVLVVEDRDSLRTMLRRTLTASGYTVLEAASTTELAVIAVVQLSFFP